MPSGSSLSPRGVVENGISYSTTTTTSDGETTIVYYLKIYKIEYGNTTVYISDNPATSSPFLPNKEYTIYFKTNLDSLNGVYLQIESNKDSLQVPLNNAQSVSNNNNYNQKKTFNLYDDFLATSADLTLYPYIILATGVQETLPATEEGASSQFSSQYIPPFYLETLDYRLDRCDEYHQIATGGQYILVTNIRLNLKSGIIQNQYQIYVSKNEGNTWSFLNEDQNGSIVKAMFSSGYSDTNEFYLFPAGQQSGYNIENIKQIYLKILYDNSHEASFPMIISNSYNVFTLVGETKLGEGKIIYGGVAIGQEPTVKEKGYPIFECAYPAYFNGRPLGFFPDEENPITFDDNFIFPGLLITPTTNFTISLGEPIYTSNIELNGTIIVYGFRTLGSGSIVSSSYTIRLTNTISGGNFVPSNYQIAINNKAGLLTVKATTSDSNGFIRGPVTVVPNNNFTITFR